MAHKDHPFYGTVISRDQQQELIKEILAKYQHEPVDDALKEKVYNTLVHQKFLGRVTIPFRVVIRKDAQNQYPPHIEVILDTKV